eukprot:3210324-Pleurochrysis_carterae.AAC.1
MYGCRRPPAVRRRVTRCRVDKRGYVPGYIRGYIPRARACRSLGSVSTRSSQTDRRRSALLSMHE